MSRVDFLGIGAQKAGTTWLWSALRAHPQIWMPPVKELHYFDRSLRYPSLNWFAADRLRERLFSPDPHYRQYRHVCRTRLEDALRQHDWSLLRWYMRYYLGRPGDNWYLSLFAKGNGRICGEITPAYAMLEEEDIAHIYRMFPELKIIFLLRNPVERAWSHIRYKWTRGRFTAITDFVRVRALIEDRALSLRGDYLRTLTLWESKFPAQQFFIGFFDDIIARPEQLLRQVCAFLGIKAEGNSLARATRGGKVNRSEEIAMPVAVRRYLASKYLPDVEKLSARFGGHAERWRAEVAAMLGADRDSA